jgi:hypothetical protein
MLAPSTPVSSHDDMTLNLAPPPALASRIVKLSPSATQPTAFSPGKKTDSKVWPRNWDSL